MFQYVFVIAVTGILLTACGAASANPIVPATAIELATPTRATSPTSVPTPVMIAPPPTTMVVAPSATPLPTSQPTPIPSGLINVDSFEHEVYPFVENGNCTLGEAIHAANTLHPVDACAAGDASGSLIELAPGVYELSGVDDTPVLLPSGEVWVRHETDLAGLPVITGKVIINGHGATITTQPNTLPRLLINLGPELIINDLTLSNGGIDNTAKDRICDGGAFWNGHGHAILNRVKVENSRADGGGGILNGGGVLELNDSVITGNHARFSGGGLKNQNVLTMTRTLVNGNTANDGGGLDLWSGVATVIDSDVRENLSEFSGGGLHVRANKNIQLTLIDSRVSGNSTRSTSGVGGGLALHYNFYGGSLLTDFLDEDDVTRPTTVTLIHTVVQSNTAGGGGGLAWAEPQALNTLIIKDGSQIVGNRATSESMQGGGLFNFKGRVLITDSVVADNISPRGGGILNRMGYVEIARSQFRGNIAAKAGGAILNTGGQIAVTDSIFADNQAAYGGAIYYAYPLAGDRAVKIPGSYTRVQGSCFSGNVATDTASGYAVGSDIHVYIDKNPVVEATDNWWAVTPQVNRHIVGDVRVQPMLSAQPEFCR
jgi:hypothetical protein